MYIQKVAMQVAKWGDSLREKVRGKFPAGYRFRRSHIYEDD
jgi:hypothetical protein